jgi:hypothetical protein
MLIDFRHGVAAFATSGGVIRSPVISFNRYDQEQQIGMIVAGQIRHVRAVLPLAAETLQFLRMRSDDHNVRAHVKFLFRLAGPVRNPGTRIHLRNAKSIDVLRPSSKAVRRPLKENFIEASGLVMRGARWWTRQASPFTHTFTENSKSPPFLAGQSKIVASSVMKCGPALCASAIFSASVTGRCWVVL